MQTYISVSLAKTLEAATVDCKPLGCHICHMGYRYLHVERHIVLEDLGIPISRTELMYLTFIFGFLL